MRWVLRLMATDDAIRRESVDLIEIYRPAGIATIADLGLTLTEAKQLLRCVQQAVVAAQTEVHGRHRPDCLSCCGGCQVKDWRSRRVATLFGEVVLRLPRFTCAVCKRIVTSIDWPRHTRSTPELRQLQAHLSAMMTYRVAAGVLQHLLPVTAGTSPETLRSHTLHIGEELGSADIAAPTVAAGAVTVSLDSTFIRGRGDGERHLEVRVGNVETEHGGRQVLGAVAKAGTGVAALLRRSLQTVGRNDDTQVTAFTDGGPGLRSILVEAGIPQPPILDWFHVAMRLQHATQSAGALSTDNLARVQAKAMIVDEVERLRWRIWNGKAKNARKSLDRVRKIMHVYRGERLDYARSTASRRLWHALHNVDGYLRSQRDWLVNYASRYRAGQRVGSSITEGTANFLVNRRMNKSQQMRWSRRGADLLMQVRCAVYNGTLGSGFGQIFQAHPERAERSAKTA